MTNKNGGKLKEELNFSFNEGYEQGRLAILRKWKKAMEWVVITPKGDLANYHKHLNKEYLKAKGK